MRTIETVNKANVLVDDEDVIGKVKNERCKDCGGATSAPTAE
jgi:hypothetical protein